MRYWNLFVLSCGYLFITAYLTIFMVTFQAPRTAAVYLLSWIKSKLKSKKSPRVGEVPFPGFPITEQAPLTTNQEAILIFKYRHDSVPTSTTLAEMKELLKLGFLEHTSDKRNPIALTQKGITFVRSVLR